MNPPADVLFDLDGTLSDSAPGIVASMVHAFEVLGLDVPHHLDWTIGPPLLTVFRELGLPEPLIPAAVDAYRERYSTVGLFENEVYDGIEELLGELSDRGTRLAIATSKPEPFAIRILERFSLSKYFEVIAGATLDGSRGLKADVVAHAIAQLPGFDPASALMVGDRHHDVEGSAEHGVSCVGVLWGYGTRHELESAGAWALAASPAELATVLS